MNNTAASAAPNNDSAPSAAADLSALGSATGTAPYIVAKNDMASDAAPHKPAIGSAKVAEAPGHAAGIDRQAPNNTESSIANKNMESSVATGTVAIGSTNDLIVSGQPAAPGNTASFPSMRNDAGDGVAPGKPTRDFSTAAAPSTNPTNDTVSNVGAKILALGPAMDVASFGQPSDASRKDLASTAPSTAIKNDTASTAAGTPAIVSTKDHVAAGQPGGPSDRAPFTPVNHDTSSVDNVGKAEVSSAPGQLAGINGEAPGGIYPSTASMASANKPFVGSVMGSIASGQLSSTAEKQAPSNTLPSTDIKHYPASIATAGEPAASDVQRVGAERRASGNLTPFNAGKKDESSRAAPSKPVVFSPLEPSKNNFDFTNMRGHAAMTQSSRLYVEFELTRKEAFEALNEASRLKMVAEWNHADGDRLREVNARLQLALQEQAERFNAATKEADGIRQELRQLRKEVEASKDARIDDAIQGFEVWEVRSKLLERIHTRPSSPGYGNWTADTLFAEGDLESAFGSGLAGS